ncbi:MAG: ABC transporter ATP-binding protein [Lachnospiraceae bacterium]|jgi:ABC-2 type transport system ATP-binding protein|nr:ABC transporter ATP-binding protein [Lachnospiraceae bacterium]MBO4809157.1 ABC transporter ATP-binding protein [Lachnospiraceae bacterium]
MKEYVIETVNLCKKSGEKYRVKDLNLAVPKGATYGFLGPNGAGKTTTMKLMLGLIKPDGGSVEILGKVMKPSTRFMINKRTGSLIESPGFYGHLTGQENLEIIAKYKNLGARDVEEALKTVNLYERKDDKVKKYSLGMKQRLGIAMALMGKPELIILDEPTNGLDPAGINEIRKLIKSIPEKFGSTVIISSHLLSEVEQMADYVGIINKGQMIYEGPLAELERGDATLEEVFLEMTKEA